MQRLTPEGLTKPTAYTQVIVSSRHRLVFISGQVSQDADGKLVASGDFAGQAKQVYANLGMALKGAGARAADVIKLTTFVVGYKPELRAVIARERANLFGSGEMPASTLVGVEALAEPGYLIEIEAVAATD